MTFLCSFYIFQVEYELYHSTSIPRLWISLEIEDTSTPLSFFFSNAVWDLMKVETNRYANTYIESNPRIAMLIPTL